MGENTREVAVGAGGVLFLRSGSNRVADQLAGSYPLPDDFGAQWAALFEGRAEVAQRMGARYLHFIAPAKECVLETLLPPDMPVVEDRPVQAVLAAAGGRVDALYPLEAFRALGEVSFGRHDSHWRAEGAILAYRSILEALGIDPLDDDRIDLVAGAMNDLGAKLGAPAPIEPHYAVPASPHHVVVSDNRVKPLGNLIVTEVGDPSLPTAVIFRDSFLTTSHRLLAQHFRRLVFAWQPNLDFDIIERERPDFIITEQAERFLVAVPDDANGKTNAEYVAEKLRKAA